jgi:YVTN family beta-propeller protein
LARVRRRQVLNLPTTIKSSKGAYTNEKSNAEIFKAVLGAGVRVVTLALFLVVFGASTALAQTRGYVANFLANSVSVIDPAANTVIATVPVGAAPKAVAVTPNGAFAYGIRVPTMSQ